MIESILSPRTVERKPWEAFIAGVVFTFVAGLITLQIGATNPQGAGMGLLLVSFITIAATPFFLNIFRIEEKQKRGNLFQRHADVIEIFAFFFGGVIVASSLLHILLPLQSSAGLFLDQSSDLKSRGIISGQAVTGLDFADVLFNNLKVLGLMFVFSFVFGAGAVFIISWNATIIGTLIAKIAENPAMYGSVTVIQGNALANYLVALPFTLLRILPHGIFEFLGYFIGAVAGGILSVAIIRERLLTEKERVLKDALIYMGIGAACIAIGAAIEVWV